MNYHAKFQGKILQNIDFIKCLVSYHFFLDDGVYSNYFYLNCLRAVLRHCFKDLVCLIWGIVSAEHNK